MDATIRPRGHHISKTSPYKTNRRAKKPHPERLPEGPPQHANKPQLLSFQTEVNGRICGTANCTSQPLSVHILPPAQSSPSMAGRENHFLIRLPHRPPTT